MTFLHLSLLAGSALVAVPIILHLIMRKKPTRLEFPALRFVQKRADANRRRLRLRHLLLLLLGRQSLPCWRWPWPGRA